MSVLIHRHGWSVIIGATAIAAAEWLRRPAPGWTFAVAVLLLGAIYLSWPRRQRWMVALSLALAALTLAMAIGGRRLSSIEHRWPAVRERLVTQASQQLETELRQALHRADAAAAKALEAAKGDRAAAFSSLAQSANSAGPELGLAILEPTGTPWAWAGRHRLLPHAEGDSIAVRADGYYVVLETRRHSPEGRVAVASTLIWAHSTAPRPEGSLSARFASRTRVGLEVFPPGTAPHQSDLFDFEEPTTAGPRLLFSVLPVPPDQGEAKERELDAAGRGVAAAAVLVLLIGVLGAAGPATLLASLLALLWLGLRSPAGSALGFEDFFSPATFFRASFGPFTTSAGALGLSSLLLLLAGFWLWRRSAPRRPWQLVVGVLLLGAAPSFLTELGRGITPPLNGVSAQLWATWQVVLALAASAVIVLAAACLRPGSEKGASDRGLLLGAGIALIAALTGLRVWSPPLGYPTWYTLLWLPALFLVARSTPRWGSVVAIAFVAGSAASLVTWAAVLNGRIAVAQRDLGRLGEVEDPLAEPLLERLAEQLTAQGGVRTSAEMYALWRTSYLGEQDYPVRLTLWSARGERVADLSLDSLDLPTPLLSALVQGMDSSISRTITRAARVPGLHYILIQRLSDGDVFTAVIGPRTRLITPTRLSRLLRPPAEGAPLYDLALTPPGVSTAGEPAQVGWRRVGWEVRNERPLTLFGAVRHAHASVSLHAPLSLAVRGALLVLLDATVVIVIWLLTTVRLEGPRRRWSFKRVVRSFQVRLAATLAVFFVVPAAGFAAWNFSRFDAEAARSRDLLISQVLRDAVFTAGGLLRGPGEILTFGMQELSDRLDADLALYSGGTLLATSAPILHDLGLVEPLVDPRVFVRLGLGDEIAQIRNGTTYMSPVRVGYRVVQSGPPGGIGILATPQVADDWFLAETQRDLAFILLLATLVGIAAAVAAAQVVARALARPVEELRTSALSLGRGETPPPPETPPVEFEELFGAFARMSSDIRSSQAALESARRRTAAVLADVATGVLALDARGGVIIANPRAREMLGLPLAEGEGMALALGAGWAPLATAMESFTQGGPSAGELEIEGRRLRYQLERLGTDVGGTVLSLDDITDVTQAERVLAWGEMARQVAHEIKNPLTPLRLGIQHLRRVYRERRTEFDETLETTSSRILAEIDRLDTIARGFSRFGLPLEDAAPLESVDLLATAREVADLYRLTGEGVSVSVKGNGPLMRPARRDELKEVLGNLVENARNAGASSIELSVAKPGFAVTDNGRGIPAELLPRIFEPRFSTTTSGSGLGLAIVKRLVESWGAEVAVQSVPRQGTTVAIAWPDGVAQGPASAGGPR